MCQNIRHPCRLSCTKDIVLIAHPRRPTKYVAHPSIPILAYSMKLQYALLALFGRDIQDPDEIFNQQSAPGSGSLPYQTLIPCSYSRQLRNDSLICEFSPELRHDDSPYM